MLFALILIGFESVNVFLQGQAGFFELLATLAMLYLIYKFLVPLAERFLVFFTKANVAPQQRQAPRRRVGVVERFADSTGKAVGDSKALTSRFFTAAARRLDRSTRAC